MCYCVLANVNEGDRSLQAVRSILVALLAVAIAMLPASMGVTTAAAAAGAVTVAAPAMPDCEHHRHQHPAPVKQTQKTVDHSNCISGCALCFGFVGPEFTGMAHVITPSAALQPMLAGTDICSLMGSPPFRPPRS